MCGIAGIFSFNAPIETDLLKNMTDAIAHRGPDGEGHWTSSNQKVGLGHRRLSIIDLSVNGKQPMQFSNGNYTITFNGEIYNYIELRESLIRQGYSFMTGTDTEVILALYDLKKEKCLQDMDGMFSFAIWNEREQTLFCARDRFGEKPFHYYRDNEKFVFASEIKQFWAYGIPKKMLSHRLSSYLRSGEIDNPEDATETFYENIKRLDAAHYLLVKANGKPEIHNYWKIDLNAPAYTGSIEQATERFAELFTNSVKLRLRSDVPLGTSLSGGLDSSSIVMIIDKLKGKDQPQTTFSARFNNFDKDEGTHIDTVIKACGNIIPHSVWPDDNYFLQNFDRINHFQDEPYGSASIVAQYSVMELAKQKGVTVLIDGQGADEYLGGYMPYYKLYLDQLFYNSSSLYKKELKLYNSLHANTRPYLAPDVNESVRMKLGRYKRKFLSSNMFNAGSAVQKKLLSDTTSAGLKTLLRYADRNSMAHSREVRLPFLSHELVEFVFSLPVEYKLNSGRTKYVLRRSMNNVLPDSICWRIDKIGYASPQEKWMSSPEINRDIEDAFKIFGISPELKNETPVSNSMKWRALVARSYNR